MFCFLIAECPILIKITYILKKSSGNNGLMFILKKVINHDIDESDSDESDSDEYEDRKHLVGNTKQQKQTDGKLVFVYQSLQMKRLYRLYAPSLLLLDATYKTRKYTVPLFFVVVNTNVNF